MISWIGLPDNHYPSEEDDWEGSMTVPRELTIEDDNLIQQPISGIEKIRNSELNSTDPIKVPCEILIENKGDKLNLNLFTSNDTEGFTITYDKSDMALNISKTGMILRYNEEIGEELSVPLKQPLKTLRIFIDKSSIEIFINDGESTFTSHIYPTEIETGLEIEGDVNIKIWELETTVADDFIIE